MNQILRALSKSESQAVEEKHWLNPTQGYWRIIESLIEPVVRGDPESLLRRVAKSTYRLADELNTQSHTVCQRSISNLLTAAGYSL